MQTRNPVQCNQESDLASSSSATLIPTQQQNDELKDNNFSSKNEYKRMFFTPSELNVSQIVDNPKVNNQCFLGLNKCFTYLMWTI